MKLFLWEKLFTKCSLSVFMLMVKKKKKNLFFFFFDAPMSHLLPLSSGQVKPLLGRFSELGPLVEPGSVDAVLLDAGCSSMQMDQANRGFSLSKDGPLDMRMDGER